MPDPEDGFLLGAPVAECPPNLNEAKGLRKMNVEPLCAVPISLTIAALGGEIEVPTLAGKAAMDIRDGTQAGKQFRLRDMGIKTVRSATPATFTAMSPSKYRSS